MTNLICDTNVFRNLGHEDLEQGAIAKPGEQICYSPLTVLELSGKMSNESFESRKAAAQTIISSKAKLLLDPESWLTELFGNEQINPPFDYSQAVLAMAQANTLTQLQAGVPDLVRRVQRRVSISTAGSWREATEKAWLGHMTTIMRDHIPDFEKWEAKDARKRGRKPRLRGNAKADFLAMTKAAGWFTELLLACQTRSFHNAKKSAPFQPTPEFVEKLKNAIDKVCCYCGVYTQYLIELLTDGMMPQLNDSGDTEFFLYSIDDGHIIVTSERRWANIAERAGFAHRVRRVGHSK